MLDDTLFGLYIRCVLIAVCLTRFLGLTVLSEHADNPGNTIWQPCHHSFEAVLTTLGTRASLPVFAYT